MLDRPATNSTLLTVASGQLFSTSLIPTAVGNSTKVFDADSALTDTSISGAYIDEIWLQYSKRRPRYLDPKAATGMTWSAVNTTATITIAGGHNCEVGDKVWLIFSGHSSGAVPVTGEYEVATVGVTGTVPTTFTVTVASVGGSPITGTTNSYVYEPIDFGFYLVGTGTITNVNQFFPLFNVHLPTVPTFQSCSLTAKAVLPYINHPVVQAGANVGTANSTTAIKHRGLMLQRGQALYCSVSGATALSNGYYCNIQGGYY